MKTWYIKTCELKLSQWVLEKKDKINDWSVHVKNIGRDGKIEHKLKEESKTEWEQNQQKTDKTEIMIKNQLLKTLIKLMNL